MSDPLPLSAVGRTALAVALARAAESDRSDAWFVDPLAQALAAQIAESRAASGAPAPRIGTGLQWWIAVRTRFLDDVVRSATAAAGGESSTAGGESSESAGAQDGHPALSTDSMQRGAPGRAGDGLRVRQIVIVGAGLDARAFRLPLTGDVCVYEFDRSDVLDIKQRIVGRLGLRSQARRTVVAGDIMDADWLASIARAGWNPREPTLWILEGFLIYFEPAVRTRIVTELASASVSGSRLAATVSTRAEDPTHPLWKAFDDLDFAGWFAECGWRANVSTMRERSAEYGRPIEDERPDDFAGVLIDATLA